MELWWNYTDKGEKMAGKKTCPSATMFTTNLTNADLGLKSDLCG
jgi:hypothetical protein